MPWRMFDIRWFERWQDVLYFLLNAPVVRWWSRWVLRINGGRSSIGRRKVQAVLPNAIFWLEGETVSVEFRTHAKFSKRIYHAFKWVWWTLHFFDWLIADRFAPSLSFGFNTLTQYPDEDTETNTVDGYMEQRYSTGSGVSWATLISDPGNGSGDADNPGRAMYIAIDTVSSQYTVLIRSIFLFDTSPLGQDATISSAVFSLYGAAAQTWNSMIGTPPDVNVYTSDPASNTAIVDGDFDSIGTTAQCDTAIGYSSWSTAAYNDFSLNATGIGNISLTGVTKFGTRNANYDVSGTPPTWGSDDSCAIGCYFAEQAGTVNDPKLVVAYAFTHTGSIFGTGHTSGQRTIEKVKQGAISGAGYAGATRTIEKVIPGAFQGVGFQIADVQFIPGAQVIQEGYRFRDNDGDESAATFLGTQDVAYQGSSGAIRRLRFVINSTGDPASQQFQIEWRWAGGSTWRKLIQ